jgi:two-component system, LytTR family, response regulator
VHALDYLLRDTMKRLETDLESAGFVRLHRSTMVNGDRIKELQQTADGDWEVVLTDGTRLGAGRDADTRLRQVLARRS